MAIGRSLTKKFQKLSPLGRARENGTDQNGDYFYSISFEQTVENNSSEENDYDASSLSSSNNCSQPTTPLTPPVTRKEALDFSNPISRQSTAASSIYSGHTPATNNTSPALSVDEPYFVTNEDGSINAINKGHHRHHSSVDKQPKIVEEDEEATARADEMAMHILEKVSADDYVREIKVGSWYI
ncbi:hypothetical protein TRVA0_002S03664 [Trichomonascus vanleenenianus]|uniref:uncharacterized protein n=1 Tax=Trichomonascus vanleenenianus TaxID=2268995 RepID=UPI003EC982BB